MNPLIFRTAGGDGYGYGHISRSLTLADQLRSNYPNVKIEFHVTGPRWIFDKITQRGYTTQHVPEIAGIGKTGPTPAAIIVDMLEPAHTLLARYRSNRIPLLIFSDLAVEPIDGAIVVAPQHAESIRTKFLYAGPDYMVMDTGFGEINRCPRRIIDDGTHLLITLGGEHITKTTNFIRSLVTEQHHQWKRITWIVGSDTAVDASTVPSHVNLLPFTQRMPTLIQSADIALVAGGFTKLEAACCGTPACIVAICEHQTILGRAFARHHSARYLGSIDTLDAKDVAIALEQLRSDPAARSQMSQSGKQLVDGRGAERVCSIVASLLAQDNPN